MAEKKELIYGAYRNEAFYENFYKGKSAAQAYVDTAEYLKKPTFRFEKDCALKVYMKVYGIKFQSSEQRQIESQAEEITRLRAELEARTGSEKVTDDAETVNETGNESDVVIPTDFPKGMDKDAFKEFYVAQYKKIKYKTPHWTVWDKAWKNYKKNEVPA